MKTQLTISNTLTIKHYQNMYNLNKVNLVKKSPAGHYFVNQLVGSKGNEFLVYPAFKRVSKSTLNTLLSDCIEVDMLGYKTVMSLSVAECLLSSREPLAQYKINLEYRTIQDAKKYYNLGYAYLKEFNNNGLYKEDIDKLYLYSN